MRKTWQRSSVVLVSSVAIANSIVHAQQAPTETAPPPDAEATTIQYIIVTATRQSQVLSEVPISVAAFNAESMEKVGAKQIDDLVRLTPGLEIERSGTGSNNVSIRGISSSAGAGVTGIYIDDTPIQANNLGYGAGSAFPEIFDLERIEVLRGPQGTLFGAGSEGGTVRFIQSSPNMSEWSSYTRAELAQTHKGDVTYEGGLALGGPIVEDKIGFRAHVYYRREGGYVDAVEGTVTPNGNPGTYPYGDLVDFTKTRSVRKDTNSSNSLTARLAIEFRPVEWLRLTPSISYQRVKANDGDGSFWVAASDIGDNDFSRVVYRRGNPATDPGLTALSYPDEEEAQDKFTLSSLAANIDLGAAELISNTSYFDRTSFSFLDFTAIDAFQFAGEFFVPTGWKSMSRYGVGQENFVQEIRLQSTDSNSRLRWVAGGFYSRNRQASLQSIGNNFVANLAALPPFGAVAGGSPFGPGSSAIENALGAPLLPGTNASYFEDRDLVETQYAGFAQLDYQVIDTLTLIAGVRVSRNKLELDAIFRGPLNNDNTPGGRPCPTDETCVVGAPGTFAPVYVDTVGFETAETAVTPKVGVSWQATPDDLFYATVAKGFRPAGVNARVPTNFCGPDLIQQGYFDSNGQPVQPQIYDSDSVWSYELGAKNQLFDGRLYVDASAYIIKWADIQNAVSLPTCLYIFVDNLSDVTSKGVDLSVDLKVTDGFQIGGTAGYNKATYDQDVATPGGTVLGAADSPINAARPWKLSGYAQYEWDRFYVRGDVNYSSAAVRYGTTDPNAPIFNPALRRASDFTQFNLRAGAVIGDADVSLFVDNLTNSASLLANTAQFNNAVYIASTHRPRTIGLAITFRR